MGLAWAVDRAACIRGNCNRISMHLRRGGIAICVLVFVSTPPFINLGVRTEQEGVHHAVLVLEGAADLQIGE